MVQSDVQIQDTYQTRIEKLEKELGDLKKKNWWYGTFRFLFFGGAVFFVYWHFQGHSPWSLWLALGLVALFVFLLRRHLDLKYQQSILTNLVRINQNEIDVIRKKPSFFPDGTPFHQDYSYTMDLDIFGHRSVYHMINRCFSEVGRQKLAAWFMNDKPDKEEISQRQTAIVSLRNEIGIRQDFCAHGLAQLSEKDVPAFPDEPLMSDTEYRITRILSIIMPLITLASAVWAVSSGNYKILLYGFLLNIVINGMFYKVTARVLQKSAQNLQNLSKYKEPLKVLTQAVFHNELVRDKQQIIAQVYHQLQVLQKRYGLLESRENDMVGILFNGFIGYDFIILQLVNRWYMRNYQQIPEWLDEIAWFEALFSLSTFAYNNPTYHFADFDKEMGLSGTNIRHPFIPEQENVGNLIELIPPLQVILLTGSNMSGKSTFLRSVGVNQVLALAGSVVAADSFHTGLYGILTSFRKSDSIQEQTSLFYDELKKLQFINRQLDEGERPYLVLLDEILRGTNSDDKYFGSRQVLLQLKDQSAMTILATHDIALASLEEEYGPSIQNYSFESEIRNGELYFDYKLHQGVAVNKNATFLMEKMGIIPAGHLNHR